MRSVGRADPLHVVRRITQTEQSVFQPNPELVGTFNEYACFSNKLFNFFIESWKQTWNKVLVSGCLVLHELHSLGLFVARPVSVQAEPRSASSSPLRVRPKL